MEVKVTERFLKSLKENKNKKEDMSIEEVKNLKTFLNDCSKQGFYENLFNFSDLK
jgi:hypothetical protein